MTGSPPPTQRAATGAKGYLLALLVVCLGIALRLALNPFLDDRLRFLTTFGMVALAVWVARWKPAALAALVGFIVPHLLFSERPFALDRFFAAELGGYVFSAGLIILFGEMMHRSRATVADYAVRCRDAEESERRQKELLRVTFASIGDAVIATDARGRVTTLNLIAEELTGWAREDATGRPLDEIFRIVNEDSRAPVENPATRSLRDGIIVGLANHTVLVTKDGRELPIDDSAAPIRSESGEILGCVLVFRDVSRRRAEERETLEQREMLRITLASIGDGVIVTDESGAVQSLNPEAEHLTGWTNAEAAGRPLAEVFTIVNEYNDDAVANPVEEVLRTGTVVGLANHTVLIAKDGRRTPIDDSAAPIREGDGPLFGVVLVFRDVGVQRNLQRAREHLAAIVEYSGDAIITKDLHGVVQSWNRSAQELFGYTSEDIVGKPITTLVPPDRLEEEGNILQRLREGQPSERVETVRVAKDGRRLFVSLSVSPLRDADGEIIGASSIAHDITTRKIAEDALRESEQRFRDMANASPMLIWMSGTDRRFTWFNKQWLDFVGRPMERELGNGWAENVHPDDHNHCMETYVTKFDAREPFSMMYRLRRHDGQYRWMMDIGNPRYAKDGEFAGYIGSCVDITERRNAEESLREADRRKDEFLAVLSHELRNPLAPISMAVTLMQRRAAADPQEQELRNIIQRQTTQLARLLDDLLDVNRIRSGKVVLRRERMNLDGAVSTAVEAIRPQIDAKVQKLVVDVPREPVFVNADPARMAQVIANLLGNAVKYTDRGGNITLTVMQRDGHAVLIVRDSGIGIRPEQMTHIFDMFAQVNPTLDRADGGLGVGLSLTRSLVELHGGHIEVQSEGPGKGSQFIVSLPIDISEPASAPHQEPKRPATAQKPRRVLVADDNVDSARMLATALRQLGHDVRVAHDGVATIEEAKQFEPEVAFLDIGMPRMNGYDAGKTLRGHFGDRIRLVAITGWGQEADKRRAAEASFDHHMTKPVEIDAVEDLLRDGA
ncbi:MAG TPA: PAS domain S-box protein [Candidatus Krumholzibacteria bacterium]